MAGLKRWINPGVWLLLAASLAMAAYFAASLWRIHSMNALIRDGGIEKLSPGPNTVGTKVRYAYREGGRTGTMDGEIKARTPNERLTVGYSDKMMEVVVDFQMTKKDGGARLVHTIDIKPKSLMAKLFAPLVRRQLPQQTITAMETLRGLVEGAAGT